jgi:hypothetical protein
MASNARTWFPPRARLAALAAAFLTLFALAGTAGATPETDCYAFVQGNIPWDYAGSTAWADANVQNLCAGTTVAAEPGRCFDRVMQGGISWGGGTQWQWENALNLCKGTSSADATIGCFQGGIAAGVPWPQAITECQVGAPSGPTAAEAACFTFVQGNIPWDYSGSTVWAEANVQNLCAGTSVAAEPGRCFDHVMHGGVDWGGSTQWEWQNALDLCAGTSNADATVACFQSRRALGLQWPAAIAECRT